jgi:hypothetical protein
MAYDLPDNFFYRLDGIIAFLPLFESPHFELEIGKLRGRTTQTF